MSGEAAPTPQGKALHAEIVRLNKEIRGLANGMLGALSWTTAAVCIMLLPAMVVGLITDAFRFRDGSAALMPSIVAVGFLLVMGGAALALLLYLDRIAALRARRLAACYTELYAEATSVPVWHDPRWSGGNGYTLGPTLAPSRTGTESLVVVACVTGLLLTVAGVVTVVAGDLEAYTYGISTLAVAALTFGYAVRTGMRLRRIRRAQALPGAFVPDGRAFGGSERSQQHQSPRSPHFVGYGPAQATASD